MADIIDSVPFPVFAIDRAAFASRGGLVAAIKFYPVAGRQIGVFADTASIRPRRGCHDQSAPEPGQVQAMLRSSMAHSCRNSVLS